jgi:hypothetical protein
MIRPAQTGTRTAMLRKRESVIIKFIVTRTAGNRPSHLYNHTQAYATFTEPGDRTLHTIRAAYAFFHFLRKPSSRSLRAAGNESSTLRKNLRFGAVDYISRIASRQGVGATPAD